MEKLKSKLKHLHRYHTAQQKAIREHIEEHFGKIYLQVEDVKEDGLRIDIDIIKAEPERGVEYHSCYQGYGRVSYAST